nr:hypothetical protein [Staphylococcus hominis]
MFENLLASIGINSVKVETLVKNRSIHSNDTNELQTFTLHTNVELKEHHTITEEFKFNIYEYEFKSEPKHLILKTHAYVGYSVDAYDEDKIVFK